MANNKLKASTFWRQLHGLLCLFKPMDITLGRLLHNITTLIPEGLNKMEVPPPRHMVRYDASLGVPMEIKETDYSDHPLVIGPRYEKSEIRYFCAAPLGIFSSGVCLVGLNRGKSLAQDLEESKPLRAYHLFGRLGIGTDNQFKSGKVVEKAMYHKVYKPHVDRVVAAMQASNQRNMFLQSGVDIRTQTAYNLAVQGLIRPVDNSVPIIYGIKCIDFQRPSFTIEVTCVNETEQFLLDIISAIGFKVRSVAHCNGIKCIRYGPFTLNHALLQHSWTVQNFAANIQMCNAINEVDLQSGRRSNIKLSPLNIEDSVPHIHKPEIDAQPTTTHQVPMLRRPISRHQQRRAIRSSVGSDVKDKISPL